MDEDHWCFFYIIIFLKAFLPWQSDLSLVECDLAVVISPGEQRCVNGVHEADMGGNGVVGRGNGIIWGSGSNQLIGGGGGISTVDASITWDKMPPTINPPASVNVESVRTGILAIGCLTTTLNVSSFKWSGTGASKTWTETGSMMFVSPLVFVVAAASLYPLSPPV